MDTDPTHQSQTLGSRLVFQCKVSSEDYPTIKWFRRLPPQNDSNRNEFVHYNGYAYELLNTPKEKSLSNNLYLSKLIVNEIREEDVGYYACVAITIRGHSIRVFQLSMDTDSEQNEDYWSEYDEETPGTDPKEFWLLFLMPLGLALLPLMVWLCYLGHKRCHQSEKMDLSSEDQQYSEGDFSAHRRMLRS